jgi:hypothetical protein
VEAQEKTTVLLERLVVAIKAMSSLVIRQEGHVFLVAKQGHCIMGASTVAMEAGCLCAEHMMGAEDFTQCWDSWEMRFKMEVGQLPQVIVVDVVGEGSEDGAERDKVKGKGRE